jgi:dolichol-phosphate mannosyltransferase
MTPWRRFLRFNLVGALGIGVQLTGLWVLVEVGRAPYLVATAVAVSAAIVHNFLWHVWWTWRDRPARGRAVALRFGRFVLANGLVSFAGNLGVMTLLVGGAGLSALPANLIAIATCGLANFWLGDTVVFFTTKNTKTTKLLPECSS